MRVTCIVATLIVSGCTGLTRAPETRPGENEALKRQIVELRQRATVAELEAARLGREVSRLTAELEREKEAAQANMIEPSPVAIELDPVIEETDLEEPPPPQARGDKTAANPPLVEASNSSEQTPAPTIPSAEAQALYDEGYTLFNQKSYRDAESKFRRYVELYPRTDLADNALFWIGECRYATGDFASALEAFSETVELYPEGNKVADAMLKAGKCLESLGDTAQARQTYEEVRNRYPGTAAAAQARDRLRDQR